ncbi:uncharacterized protein M6B38_271015 [Iris pallida]|uniref:Uncharacterized protein n=1 Tax=Iris pallida TaxID=29817 RepID=A0AAX6GBF3_IRIPA|nr:uncharacterized protein M6B38_374340 [Iris pallida]KAJ6849174.1 uncharacterized protein M6B38_271015 [Iris pallida]
MACMAMLSSSPYRTAGNPPLQHHGKHSTPCPRKSSLIYCRSRSSTKKENNNSSGNDHEFPLAKLAVVALAAGVLALGSAHEAMAAKSGGRVGGQAFRSAAPKSSGPRINNSRTNIYVNPPVAPPLVGGYGYGYGVPFYGGWGWSPFSFFAPGPSVVVGFGGGLELFAAMFAFAALAAVVRRFRRGGDEDDD